MRLKTSKYIFNPETIQYEKIKFSFRKLIYKSIPHFIVAIGCGIGAMFLYIALYDSPEVKILRRENRFLRENIAKAEKKLNNFDKELNEIAQRDNYIYRITYEQDTIPYTIRNSGIGGKEMYANFEGYSSSDIVKDVAKKLDQLERKFHVQTQSYIDLMNEATTKQKYFSNAPILQPIHINQLTRFSSGFGYRKHPILKFLQEHKGIDLTAPVGTPVYAAGDGVIKSSNENSFSNTGYGKFIDIDHQIDGLSSKYAHLSKIIVKEGQTVKRGEKIGEVGNTGLSTAPHLHYEIRINGEAVNPLRFMLTPSATEYEQLIKMAEKLSSSFD